MKNIKKTLLVIVAMILMCAMSAAATLALFNSETKTVENTFVFGNVTITLDEAPVDAKGKKIENADRVLTNLYDIDPKGTYDKDPTIHNVGNESAYLRAVISLDKENIDALFELEDGQFQSLEQLVTMAAGWQRLGTMHTETEYVFVYNYIGDNNSGTLEAVAPEADVVVFTQFTVPKSWEGDGIQLPAEDPAEGKKGVDFITVKAYAIQSEWVDAANEASNDMDNQWKDVFGSLKYD